MSHLQTKDLTRALTVSKHWQKSILGSIALKRILFLEAAPEKEYLYHESVLAPEGYGYVSRYSLIFERKEGATTIVELHPALVPYSKSFTDLSCSYVKIGRKYMSCDRLRAVHPATFLSQPPLEGVRVSYIKGRSHWIERAFRETGGMTFGKLLRAMSSLWEDNKDEFMLTHPRYAGYVREEENEEKCKVFAPNVVASDSDEVETARKELAKAQTSSGLEELDTNQAV